MRLLPSRLSSSSPVARPRPTALEPASDAASTASPPSSATTSPPSSPNWPSAPHRQHCPSSPHHFHHLFNLSFHPHSSNKNAPTRTADEAELSRTGIETFMHNINPDISTSNNWSASNALATVLRGRSAARILRRQPSAVERALSEERSRCDGDAIERHGLGLMEPRPVAIDADTDADENAALRRGLGAARTMQPPRFVMGGIIEVMEGRA